MSEQEILFEQRGSVGIITLNRPKALNALTLNMVRAMTPQMRAWAADDHVKAVLIRSVGERGFCAGGDIRALYESGRDKTPYASDFWGEEYKLNTLIKEFPKPYVALLQGIVMGGGVGLSVHGSYRVACESTVFAMPETGIGLFPDVGGTYFLPRLPGRVGMYLALTGVRLKTDDIRALGIATHVAPFAAFDEIEMRLVDANGDAASALKPYAAPAETAPIRALTNLIDRHFGGESVEEILASLDADGGEWARQTAETIRTKSPTSLKITFRQMIEGRSRSFRDCMQLEYRLTQGIQEGTDFYEGVRATIIDKDGAPKWNPSDLAGVTRDMVDEYFKPRLQEWKADE